MFRLAEDELTLLKECRRTVPVDLGEVGRRRWRTLVRQSERLLAELTCLGPILMVPYQPTLSEAITEGGENRTLARDGFRESITNTRPAVIGVGA